MLLFLLLPLSLPAAVHIYQNMQDFQSQNYNAPVQFQPILAWQSNATEVVNGPPFTKVPVKGVLIVSNIVPSHYKVTQNLKNLFIVIPTDGTNGQHYTLTECATNGLSIFAWTGNPGMLATNVIDVVASNNVTIRTNGLLRYISASISGGTVSGTDLTNAINAQVLTNHSDVTITSLTAGDLLSWSGSAWTNGQGLATHDDVTNHVSLATNVIAAATSNGTWLKYDAALLITGGYIAISQSSDTTDGYLSSG